MLFIVFYLLYNFILCNYKIVCCLVIGESFLFNFTNNPGSDTCIPAFPGKCHFLLDIGPCARVRFRKGKRGGKLHCMGYFCSQFFIQAQIFEVDFWAEPRFLGLIFYQEPDLGAMVTYWFNRIQIFESIFELLFGSAFRPMSGRSLPFDVWVARVRSSSSSVNVPHSIHIWIGAQW